MLTHRSMPMRGAARRALSTVVSMPPGLAARTPLLESAPLSEAVGTRVLLKVETVQPSGSFKDRGSCYKLQRLTDGASPPAGVIAASAGNHAQGVAHHAHRLGLQATIVMPWTTPFAKVERTEGHGARVVLHGESLAESYQHALEIADAEQLTFIHPYDDPYIIAGQGTVARELLEDAPSIDTLVVPIGGGGLAAGVAVWAKHVNPDVRLLGVTSLPEEIMGGDLVQVGARVLLLGVDRATRLGLLRD